MYRLCTNSIPGYTLYQVIEWKNMPTIYYTDYISANSQDGLPRALIYTRPFTISSHNIIPGTNYLHSARLTLLGRVMDIDSLLKINPNILPQNSSQAGPGQSLNFPSSITRSSLA